MAGQNLPIELEARLLTRAADAQAKALADRTQDRFSKIEIGFNGGSFKAGSAALGKISQDADQFEKSMAAANARVLAFGTAVGVIEGMRRSFLALVKTTTDVELALTKISVVAEKDLQKAGISIERVGKQIFDVAKQTGQSWQTAADTMLEFSRQGVKPAEALKRTRDALILSRISGIDYKEAVEGLTSTLNAFNKTGIDSTAVINKLVAVDNNAAASATDLIQGLQRMASTAQLTGQSIDDAVASIATLQEITFRGGPQIGNSLKSLAIRIYDPENIKYIESLGDGMTKIRDDSLNLLSAVEIIGNLGETIKKLPKEEQINVIKNIFGQYQTNAAASLIQGMEDVNNQLSILNKNKQLSQNAGNDALSANAKLSEILASKFNTLNVQIGETLNSFGKLGVADPLSGFLDAISWIVDNLKGAAENTDFLSRSFQVVAKILGGAVFSKAGLVAIGVIIGKIAKDFVAFGLEAGRSFLRLNRDARDQEAIQQSIAAYIQQSGQNLNVLLNSEQARLNLTKQIAAAWNQSVLSAQQMAAVTKQIAVPIFNSGLRASPTGPSRRAADGFVPLVNAEMNDVKRGVGGASPNSKIVVMPNFPFGGGKRGMMVANSSETVVDYGGGKYGIMNPDMLAGRAADGFLSGSIRRKAGVSGGGQFIDKKVLENALSLMIRGAIASGKSSLELSAIINKTIGGWELSKETFVRVSKEANAFGQSLLKIAKQNTVLQTNAIPGSVGKLNTGGTGFSSSPEISGLGFRRPAYEGPIQGDPFGISNVYTPEKLEQIRKGKVFNERKQIDINNRRSEQAKIALLKDDISFFSNLKHNFDISVGQAKNKLKTEKDQLKRSNLIRDLKIYTASSKRVSDTIASKQKELFENYGIGSESIFPQKTRISENQKADQRALADRLRSKFSGRYYGEGSYVSGGGPSNPSGPSGPSGFKAGLATIDARLANQPSKKGFDSEAFNKFAAKSVIGLAALEGFASSIKGTSEGLDKFLEVTNKLAFAFTGIAALEQFGGFKITDVSDKILDLFGEGGGVFSKIGGFLAPLAKTLPIIGQTGILLTAVNDVIEGLTGKSGLQRLKEALGFASEEAENAAKSFRENLGTMFSKTGVFTSERTNKDVRQRIEDIRQQAITKRRAESKGIATSGKSAKETAQEEAAALIEDALASVGTGIIRTESSYSRTGQVSIRRIEQSLLDFDADASLYLQDALENIINQSRAELESLAASKGVKSIEGKSLIEAETPKIQAEIIRLYLEGVKKQFSTLQNAASTGRSQEFFADFSDFFIPKPSSVSGTTNAGGGASAVKINPEDQKKLFEFQNELLSLTVQDSINSLESQIKLLDIAADNPQASARNKELIGQARQKLEEQIVESVLRQNRLDFFYKNEALKVSDLPQPEKDRQSTILKTTLDNQEKEAQRSLERIRKEGDARSNAASDLERFSRAVNSANSALSSLSVLEAGFDAKVSALESRANNPALNVYQQEDLQRQINNARAESLRTVSQQRALATFAAASTEANKNPNEEERDAALKEASDAYLSQTIAINAQINALEEANKQIGFLASSSQEFGNLLIDFQRSLGRDRAQNQFNLLQSTDPQSRISGLISEQVFNQSGNKTGSELVSFISDQNALLLEQSKIRTAANASEKLELETQYELTKQILEIKKQGLSPLEEQLKIEQAINANLKDRQTFGFGVRQASAEAQTRMQNFSSDFGKTAFDGFRDGLSDAIKAAVSQTDNLKSALLDVALAFANKLRDKAIDNLADVISNSLFSGGQSKSSGGGIVSGIVSAIGGFFGGGVQKRATGGMVTGGTGKKDDVPTLLMGGEYVVPKNIVRQYGKGFFDRLRDGSVGKMAQGGYFAPGIRGQGTISGKENLLDFATQTATSGKGDLISSLSANAGLVSLEPESLRLTNFARFGDSPLVAATQDAKDQAFQLYLGQLEDEKAYAEYQAQLKKAEKEKKKQLWTSLAIAAVGAGLNYYGFGQQTASKSKETAFSGGKIRRTSERPNLGGSVQETSNGSYLSGLFKATAYGLSSIDPTTAMDQSKANAGIRGYKGFSQTVGASGRKLVPGFSVASNYFPQGTMLSINGQTFRVDDTGGMSKNIIDFFAGGDRGLYQKYSNWGGVRVTPIGRNSGGYSMGNGDTIPTMLSQDEFVLNKSATRKIGDKNLYALNNGAMPSGDNGSSAVVVAKLDELIEKTIGASNVTVNVTMNGGEEKSSNQNSDGQGDQNPRMLVQRIKEVVIGVIRDEQRPGGSLTKTR